MKTIDVGELCDVVNQEGGMPTTHHVEFSDATAHFLPEGSSKSFLHYRGKLSLTSLSGNGYTLSDEEGGFGLHLFGIEGNMESEGTNGVRAKINLSDLDKALTLYIKTEPDSHIKY